MGCDSWIEDTKRAVRITIICYSCGEEIDQDDPNWAKQHKGCEDSTGRVPVMVEEDNMIGR